MGAPSTASTSRPRTRSVRRREERASGGCGGSGGNGVGGRSGRCGGRGTRSRWEGLRDVDLPALAGVGLTRGVEREMNARILPRPWKLSVVPYFPHRHSLRASAGSVNSARLCIASLARAPAPPVLGERLVSNLFSPRGVHAFFPRPSFGGNDDQGEDADRQGD